MEPTAALANAHRSLEGLSVGDAFGEMFVFHAPRRSSAASLPAGPWRWTDDTHMALSIVEVLGRHERIAQDALAQAFARRFVEEPHRGYGPGAARLLSVLATGEDWRFAAPLLFGGGSYGNGAAMRVAPVGGYFGDPERAAQEAALSAAITHAHPEGEAGAIAVAVAAALACARPHPVGRDYLEALLPFVPESLTRQGIRTALEIGPQDLPGAVQRLGTGLETSAQDTVPFCLWSAAHHLQDYEDALWWTATGRGDVDTTCAIVGGIVALSAPRIPEAWLTRREPLPGLTPPAPS